MKNICLGIRWILWIMTLKSNSCVSPNSYLQATETHSRHLNRWTPYQRARWGRDVKQERCGMWAGQGECSARQSQTQADEGLRPLEGATKARWDPKVPSVLLSIACLSIHNPRWTDGEPLTRTCPKGGRGILRPVFSWVGATHGRQYKDTHHQRPQQLLRTALLTKNSFNFMSTLDGSSAGFNELRQAHSQKQDTGSCHPNSACPLWSSANY